jgi:hypothetical protein
MVVRLNAISKGCRVGAPQSGGVVHSVFPAAFNLAPGCCPGTGRLLVVLAATAGNAPHGIKVAVPDGFSFSRHVRPGARYDIAGGVIGLGTGGMTIDLRPAQTWRPAPIRPAARAGVGRAWRLAARLATPPGLARASWHPALMTALGDRDHDGVAQIARGLIGKGPGLTPAGDDIIVGLLAGLAAGPAGDVNCRAIRDRIGRDLRPLLVRTTIISSCYLGAALDSDFSELVDGVARAIASAQTDEIVCARVAGCLAWGATSGADMLAGLLCGIAAWAFDTVAAAEYPSCAPASA